MTATVMPLRWVRVRLYFTGAVLALLFAGVGYRAYRLQVREAPKLRAMAEEQYLRETEISLHRGTVHDRHGAVLAQSVEVESVYANPRQLQGDRWVLARRLAQALHLRTADVVAKISRRRYFTWLKRRVTPAEARAVRALKIRGVALATEPKRFYPNPDLAGPLLGYAGIDGHGLEGLELTHDEVLRGGRRTVPTLRDALGREVLTTGLPDTGATAGHDLFLTLDKYVQYTAERALAQGLAESVAKAGTLVALDPRTGEILAMANRPTMDPNHPGTIDGARNRAVTDPYEPGSTIKAFSVAAALDAGVARPTDRWHCDYGRYRIGRYVIHDAHALGILTTAEVIQKSSNIGASKIARRLGRDQLYAYFQRFGLGRKTGVELPGERRGLLRPPARWGEIGLATASFGHGLTATPLQVVTGLAALGNQGMLLPPSIVLKVKDASGQTVDEPRPAPRRVVKPETARAMIEMLKLVTRKGGTAPLAAVPGFEVAGKTGTAQKVDPATGGYSRDKFVASFMGLVPADSPRLAVIVVVDEPTNGHYGGSVAGPIFRRFAEETLRYLGVTANEALLASSSSSDGAPPEEPLGVELVLPSPEWALRIPPAPASDPPASQRGSSPVSGDRDPAALDPSPLPDGSMAATPGPASAPARTAPGPASAPAPAGWGEGATAATTSIVVPDFRGLSAVQVLAAAHAAGLRVELRGTGSATSQSLPPGRAPRGSQIIITLEPPG